MAVEGKPSREDVTANNGKREARHANVNNTAATPTTGQNHDNPVSNGRVTREHAPQYQRRVSLSNMAKDSDNWFMLYLVRQ